MIKRLRLLNWSLRKLRLPIWPNHLVIEVGSGGNPHPASDVLAEKFVDSSHRLKAIKIDRDLILADACKLPFRDKAFDYSIAFHVLEHVPTPELFLEEMMRVSLGGYIETPNVLYERLFPLNVHLLEVAIAEGSLIISKKAQALHDNMLFQSNLVAHQSRWKKLFDSRPELFHVCYKWSDTIHYQVLNPDQSLDWHNFPSAGYVESDPIISNSGMSSSSSRELIIRILRLIYKSFSHRKFNLEELLVCPQCRSDLRKIENVFVCNTCSAEYRAEPIPDFTDPINN